MQCKIISLDKLEEFDNLKSLTLPASRGEMEILPGHAEAFIELKKGSLILIGSSNKEIPIEKGVCCVNNDRVVIVL